MITFKIDDYMVSLYTLLWSGYFVWHGFIRKGAPIYFKAWSLAQLIISFTLFIVLFVNKGYCLFSNCQPTNIIRQFVDITFDPATIIGLKLLNLTLLFSVISKMHNFIERNRSQWEKKI